MLEAYCEGLAHALDLPRLTPKTDLRQLVRLVYHAGEVGVRVWRHQPEAPARERISTASLALRVSIRA